MPKTVYIIARQECPKELKALTNDGIETSMYQKHATTEP